MVTKLGKARYEEEAKTLYATPMHHVRTFLKRWDIWLLAGMAAVVLAFHILSLQKDLPFLLEVDEEDWLPPALRMTTLGTLNPGWFGHPGSTVLYPLALLLHVWNALSSPALLFHADAALWERAQAAMSTVAMLGRLVPLTYALLCIPLLFLLGKTLFQKEEAVAATWCSLWYPLPFLLATTIRSDSAGTFFALLSLLAILRCQQKGTLKQHVLCGIAIGLAVATRYFLVALIPTYVMALFLTERPIPWKKMMIGIVVSALTFAAVSPFVFLDFATAWSDILGEARVQHLGADGFSILGNLWYHVGVILPRTITWVQWALSIMGILLMARRRDAQTLLLFMAFFLVMISVQSLHSQRWIIQLLPLFALFAVHAVWTINHGIARKCSVPAAVEYSVFSVIILLISLPAVLEDAMHVQRLRVPSTQVEARKWMVENLPADSAVLQEWFTAPLGGTTLQWTMIPSLSDKGSLEELLQTHTDYAMTSSWRFGFYEHEPERYATENAFYRNLETHATLVREWKPSLMKRGPLLRLYTLTSAAQPLLPQ